MTGKFATGRQRPVLAPPAAVQALLDARRTPDSLRTLLQRHSVDPEALMRYAGDAVVVGSVAASVRRNRLAPLLPDELASVLEHILTANEARNRELLDAAAHYTRVINGAGITPIALKGVGMLAERRYAEPGERIASDIDLLVPPDSARDVLAALRDDGCLQHDDPRRPDSSPTERREQSIDVDEFRNDPRFARHHLPAIRRPDLPFTLELHIALARTDRRMSRWLNETAIGSGVALRPDSDPAFRRSELQVLPPELRVLHNFHHSQIIDRLPALGRIDWRHLMDGRLLVEQIGDDALVERLLATADTHGLRAELELHLWQLGEQLGAPLADAPFSPRGEALRRRFERTSTESTRRTLATMSMLWSSRVRDLAPRRMKLHYGPVPYPLALTRAATFRVTNAWRQARAEGLGRVLLGKFH